MIISRLDFLDFEEEKMQQVKKQIDAIERTQFELQVQIGELEEVKELIRNSAGMELVRCRADNLIPSNQ